MFSSRFASGEDAGSDGNASRYGAGSLNGTSKIYSKEFCLNDLYHMIPAAISLAAPDHAPFGFTVMKGIYNEWCVIGAKAKLTFDMGSTSGAAGTHAEETATYVVGYRLLEYPEAATAADLRDADTSSDRFTFLEAPGVVWAKINKNGRKTFDIGVSSAKLNDVASLTSDDKSWGQSSWSTNANYIPPERRIHLQVFAFKHTGDWASDVGNLGQLVPVDLASGDIVNYDLRIDYLTLWRNPQAYEAYVESTL